MATPYIFNATESATANDVMGFQGANYGTAPAVFIATVNSSGGIGAMTALPIVNSSDTYVAAQAPSIYTLGLYKAWVQDSNGIQSAPAFVNRARITSMEYPEVDPSRQFRLFGRNLRLAGATPTVRFVNVSTLASTPGTVSSGGDSYIVTVLTPANITPGTYTLYYSNGFGGPSGEITAPITVKVRTGGIDTFGLGVPWGADFSFAGNTYNLTASGADDTAAIQNAINTAYTAGGGLVHLTAGTYHINSFGGQGGGVGLTLKSKVVLQGDGQGSTILAFQTPNSVTTTTGMILAPAATTTIGLADMTLTCTTTVSGTAQDYFLSTSSDTTKAFILRVTFDGGNWAQGGIRMVAGAATPVANFLISNCTLKNLRQDGHTIQLKDYGNAPNTTRYVYIRNNTIPNFNLGLQLGGENVIYENNYLAYDGDYYHDVLASQGYTAADIDRNRINLSGPNNIVLNNTFCHTGVNAFVNHNDGENILSEEGGTNNVPVVLGTASSATTTTLVDTTKNWTTNYAGWDLILVDGLGNGQIRTITSSTGSTLTIDRAWDVTPEIGAKYVINKLLIPHALIKGNTIQGKEHSMYIYHGAYDAAIVGNTCTDSSELWIRAYTKTSVSAIPQDDILMNVLVADNVLTSTTWAKPSALTIESSYYDTPTDPNDTVRFGKTAFLVEARRNNVTACGTEAYSALNTFYYAIYNWHPQGYGLPLATDGIIFDRNTASNATTAYGWNPGVGGLSVSNFTNLNVNRTTYDLTHSDGVLTSGSWTGAGTFADGAIALGPINTPPATMTVEGWFCTATTGSIFNIFTNGANSSVFIATTGKLGVYDSFATGSIYTTATYNDGQWHHFAWTTDGTNNKVYIDGVLSVSAAKARVASAGYGKIGTAPAAGVSGILDEIRMWNYVRSAADIANCKDTELAGDETGLIQYWRLNETAGVIAKNGVLSSDLSDGLVGYWRFDETGGTSAADSSGNGNTATVSGSTPTWVTGTSTNPSYFCGALSLNGTTNFLSAPHNDSMNGTSGITVHARVKLDTIYPTWNDNSHGIVSTIDPNNTSTGWALSTFGTGTSQAGFIFSRGTVGSTQVFASGPTNLQAGRFYAVTATYNAITHTISLYVDGVLQATQTNARDLAPSAAMLCIGKIPASVNPKNFFPGVIDDVRIYNRPLSAQDVRCLDIP